MCVIVGEWCRARLYPVPYDPNDTLGDGAAVKSTDSQEDDDAAYTMKVLATRLNGMG